MSEATGDQIFVLEFPDRPGKDIVTPLVKSRGAPIMGGIIFGGGTLLALFFGSMSGVVGVILGFVFGALLGSVAYALFSIAGAEELVMRKRKDGVTPFNARRHFSVEADGSAVLWNMWALTPWACRFNVADVRSVETTPLVNYDLELGRVNAYNASVSARRDSIPSRRLNDETDRIAREWVVFLVLRSGETVDFARRQDRTDAMKTVADVQAILAEVANRRGTMALQQAQQARAVGLSVHGDAPL